MSIFQGSGLAPAPVNHIASSPPVHRTYSSCLSTLSGSRTRCSASDWLETYHRCRRLARLYTNAAFAGRYSRGHVAATRDAEAHFADDRRGSTPQRLDAETIAFMLNQWQRRGTGLPIAT
jgi:hypothetical protein